MKNIIKDNIRKILEASPRASIPSLRALAAEQGITSLDLPVHLGGSPISMEEMADIFAFCGEIDLNLRDLPGLGHGRIMINASSLNSNHRHLIDRIKNGLDFIAVAITEPQGGSDLHGIQTSATPVNNGYILNGQKKYVARLSQASHVIAFAKVDEHELGAFIVPLDAKKIEITDIPSLGLQGVSFGGIHFRDTFIPLDNCIGEPNEGFSLFAKHFSYWRTAMAATAIGCARGAVRQSVDWLKSRDAFGNTIGRFTHLQQDLSRHVAKVRMGWSLVASTMNALDRGEPAYALAAMAKAECIEIAIGAVEWAMHIHGARGYTSEIDLEKRFRDLLGLRIADGATDVLRGQVARSVLGETIYEQSLGRSHLISKPHIYPAEELF